MFETSKQRLRANAPRRSRWIKAAFLFGATSVAWATFATIAMKTKATPTDRRHCVIGAAPEHSHYVLVDLTDSLGAAALHRVRSEVLRASARMRAGDRLELIVLGATQPRMPALPRSLFAGCKPRSPEEGGLDRGRRILEQDLLAGWTQPIEAGLAALGTAGDHVAITSPLLATVKEIGSGAVGQSRSLLLVSDLLENSSLTQASRAPAFGELQRAGFDAAQVQGLLHGFRVQVLEIDAKRPQLQARARALWTQYFEAAGATAEFGRL